MGGAEDVGDQPQGRGFENDGIFIQHFGQDIRIVESKEQEQGVDAKDLMAFVVILGYNEAEQDIRIKEDADPCGHVDNHPAN